MAIRCAVTTVAGRLYSEERDDDTNVLLRRVPLAFDFQPLKVRLEIQMEERYADWKRWQDTRIEAQARGLAAPVITALTNKEDSSWAAYAVAINEWRLA